MLDEPSLGLAPLIARQIFDGYRTLNRQDGLTVLIVEQNANHAFKLAHRGDVMVNGRSRCREPAANCCSVRKSALPIWKADGGVKTGRHYPSRGAGAHVGNPTAHVAILRRTQTSSFC